jgi:hypothetical protein
MRLVALPWTRILTGPDRGLAYRTDRVGLVLAQATSDLLKAVLDTTLRRRGYLLIDAPPGCEIKEG